MASAHAVTVSGEAAYCPMGVPAPSASFSLPAFPRTGAPSLGDPWAMGQPSCIPGAAGPWTRTGPARAWRPRRFAVAAAKPRPAAPVPAAPAPSAAAASGIAAAGPRAVCGPNAVARDVPLTAGPAVFNVLTKGAAPNTSVTLRIDNQTTVTITVNATSPAISLGPDACAYTSLTATPLSVTPLPVSSPSGAGDDTPRAADELLGTGFLTALHMAPPLLIAGAGSSETFAPAAQGGSAAVPEVSSLLLLGSGIIWLRWLLRRRRS